jgi:hypothetical protein
MSFENGLVTKVVADPTISGLIGAGPAARMFPVVLDQGTTFPALVYQIVDTGRNYHLNGPSNLTRQRVQFSSYSTRYSVAKQITDSIRKIFEGFKGALPDGTDVQQAFLVDMRPTFEVDPNLHRRDVDIEFWYVEQL